MDNRKAARLDGRVAFITGAGRGMGRAHATVMAERGADIVAHDIRQDWLDETAEAVRSKGRRIHTIVEDVADTKAMAGHAAAAEKAMGKIDILVNNAGIGAERTGIEEVDEAWFDRMFNIHVRGHFFLTKAVVPGMKARKQGAILNISSMWVLSGHHYGATYTGAKTALSGLTKAWALEFAPWNIRVNAIAPGGVMSPMAIEKDGLEAFMKRARANPMGRFAEPEENAWLACFLCSDEGAFITGQMISANGGVTIVGF